MSEILFQLRKILPTLVLPLGVTLILLGLAITFRRRRFAAAAAALLFVASLPIVSNALIAQLEYRYPRIDAAQCPSAEAILVLGGIVSSVSRSPNMPTQWNDSIDRFESGVELFRLHKAPILLFTSSGDPSFNEGELLRRAAIDHGVPNEAIRLTPGAATTTATEALALQQMEFKRVILVTSAFHMPRACRLFRRAGIEVVPFPTDYQSEPFSFRLDRWFPNADALRRTELALHELYGNLYYRL